MITKKIVLLKNYKSFWGDLTMKRCCFRLGIKANTNIQESLLNLWLKSYIMLGQLLKFMIMVSKDVSKRH